MATLRAVLTASVLVALYYLLPLALRHSHLSTFVKLALGIFVLIGLMTWHTRTITQSRESGIACPGGAGRSSAAVHPVIRVGVLHYESGR